jgi:hypothetical protein
MQVYTLPLTSNIPDYGQSPGRARSSSARRQTPPDAQSGLTPPERPARTTAKLKDRVPHNVNLLLLHKCTDVCFIIDTPRALLPLTPSMIGRYAMLLPDIQPRMAIPLHEGVGPSSFACRYITPRWHNQSQVVYSSSAIIN